jgi:primary-amine oxidase
MSIDIEGAELHQPDRGHVDDPLDAGTSVDAPRHPLDPLTATEIHILSATIRAEHPQMVGLRFALMELVEPPKALVRQFAPGQDLPRRGRAIVLEKPQGRASEVVVDLRTRQVESWEPLDGLQPNVMIDEIMALERIVLSDPDAQHALHRRGITDLDLVQVDPWTTGTSPIEGIEPTRRLLRATAYLREFVGDNGYARPIENLVFIVDLNTHELVSIEDGEPVQIPPGHGRYDAASVGPLRTDIAPLEIIQPEGAGFTLDGHELTWQRWRLRIQIHPQEGLVLHDVRYEDQGRQRRILYRAGLSEMVVPYGDPSSTFYFRSVFDAGEYQMGNMVGSLRLGCDCLGEITYMDAVLADPDGAPMVIDNAICIHEEDFGVLWKHWDFRAGLDSEVRRSRRLVVSCFATVGNYEYGFFWYFYLDGTIQMEVKLTGIVQTRALPPGERSASAPLVAPQLGAPVHQHLFNARLDMEVDGPDNSVVEFDVVRAPSGPDNPHGNAMIGRPRLLERESEAVRDIDYAASRGWKVINEHVRNRIGDPVAYKLTPVASPTLLADPDSDIGRRAAFANHHLWVTAFEPTERHAAGTFPNQSSGDGLPRWIEQDRPLVDTDVVLWHTFGLSHYPRVEDWPIMPVEYTGFMLRPIGFFDQNPALDVPPAPRSCH